ncbi:hypothetical protein GCM10022224_074030 [Nonomuraea antimicrobica]|uniref:Uncharacterized protein n=1 Tax=Nonomuraea antimicrobica TaxID=561173 RepID=A0ABP7CYE7_9ACTN
MQPHAAYDDPPVQHQLTEQRPGQAQRNPLYVQTGFARAGGVPGDQEEIIGKHLESVRSLSPIKDNRLSAGRA